VGRISPGATSAGNEEADVCLPVEWKSSALRLHQGPRKVFRAPPSWTVGPGAELPLRPAQEREVRVLFPIEIRPPRYTSLTTLVQSGLTEVANVHAGQSRHN